MKKKTLLALTIGALLSHNAFAQSISGVVLDKSGNPVSKAKIAITGTKKVVIADKDGRFTLEDIGSGNVTLHVTAQNFSHFDKQYQVGQQGLSGLNIVLSPTAFDVIQVNATPLHSSTIESAIPVNVLSAEDLRMKQAATLGETLKNEVGVHSTYYGPVSSSPVIRGLDGPRVMITQNGLDAGDASRVGPDHAVSSEASTAQQIEVLRGPNTLFYGSGAIGGVVNVVDNRVPHTPETTAEWLVEHNTVASENLASVNFNTAGENVAFHFDGFWRDSDDFKLAGPAELEQAFEEHHDEHEEENASGRLENSSSKSSGYTVGTSYLLDNGFIGMSIGKTNRTYDVPGHAHHDEEHEEHDELDEHDEHDEQEAHGEEAVYADMEQDRYQLISKLNYDEGFISAIHTKFAYTDYNHKEIENGIVGTTFDNDSVEGRIELYHGEVNGFTGAISLHYKSSDFTAIGEEAFTPPSETESFAVSFLEEKHFGEDLTFQFGLRVENLTLDAQDVDLDLGEHDDEHDDEHEDDDHGEEHELTHVDFGSRDFTPVSVSGGLVWTFTEGYNFAVSAAYSQRAPSASELFSFGPHIGTRSFEIGALFEVHQEEDGYHIELKEDEIEMETAYNLDLTLRKFDGDLGFVFNLFYNNVNDFFYQNYTGLTVEGGHAHDEGEGEHDDSHGDELDDHADEHDEHDEDGLPLLVYEQQDAKLYGFEAQLVYQYNDALKITAFSDYIRGKLDNGENLPRIPPMRLGTTFNYQGDNFSTELNITRYARQNKTGYLETTTDGYTMVDMNFNYYFNTAMGDITLYLKGHNLTNQNARVHSSFLKNTVPMPGRGFSFGVRGGF